MAQLPNSLNVQSPLPSAPVITLAVSGSAGQAAYAYWVIANYPGGSVISQPMTVTTAPNALSASNNIVVGWPQLAGVISYDVIRLSQAASFSGSCAACAVATGLLVNNLTDAGGALSDYALRTPYASAAGGNLYLNNRDYATPQLRQIINGVDSPVLNAVTPADLPPLVSASVAQSVIGSGWQRQATPQNGIWGNIAYSPELKRIVVTNYDFSTGVPRIMTSDDGGRTWVIRSMPGTSENYGWNGLAWSPALHLFVALTHGTNSGVMPWYSMYSADGITWVFASNSVQDEFWDSITWSDSLSEFCAVGPSQINGTYFTQISTDGIHWKGAAINPATGPTFGMVRVIWVQELNKFVGVHGTPTGAGAGMAVSPDCIHWSQPVPILSFTPQRVAWSPALHLLVTVGYNAGTDSDVNRVAVSSDGVKWTELPATVNTTSWYGIAWSQQLALFIAMDQAGDIMSSPDGKNWTAATSPGAFVTNDIAWIADFGEVVAVSRGYGVDNPMQAMTSGLIGPAPSVPAQISPNTFTCGSGHVQSIAISVQGILSGTCN